jgi:excisionase family DNA binding protein
VSAPDEREILNVEEAAALVGVSVKTFYRVLHTENIPARKIGREWKFSRRALIDWIGRGRSADFYHDAADDGSTRQNVRRTRGWKIELD